MNFFTAPTLFDRVALQAFLLAGSGLMTGCASTEEHSPLDWREDPHHLSLVVAGTFESDETAPTVGLDYEYRVSEFLGIGGVVEYAGADIDAVTALFAADLHLTHQFIIQTGPGAEFIGGEGTEFVYRLGVLYEWEWGGQTISPQLHYDSTSGEDAIVLAVAFGLGF